MIRRSPTLRVSAAVGILPLAIASGVITGASVAHADEGSRVNGLEKNVRANMTAAGIDERVQERLVQKLRSGGLPDSATNKAPTRTSTVERGSTVDTVADYSDVSRRVVSVERPTNNAARTSLTSCTSSGGWKVGCRVEIKDLVSSARFVIDYQTSGSKQAKVRDFRSATCANGIGSCSLLNPRGIARATQNAAGPAWARLSYKADAGPVHASGEFGLRVSGTSVSAY